MKKRRLPDGNQVSGKQKNMCICIVADRKEKVK